MSAAPPLALPSAARGRASELVDALPYIDPLTDAERAKVDALIAAEAKQGDKKPEDYLRALPMLHPFRPATESPFVKDHPLVLKEYERVAAGQPMPPLDPSRYRLDPPPEDQRSDPRAWLQALHNAQAQLQHQQGRVLNLEAMAREAMGGQSWRAHAELQAASARALAAAARQASEEVAAANRRRKLEQLAAGQELRAAEEDWSRALKGVAEVSSACAALEREVAALCEAARREGRGADADKAVEALEEAKRRIGAGGEEEGGGGGGGDDEGEVVDAMEEA